jgi:succinate dehydrogenase/fumarate reductase-like Fe-S protein
MRGGRSKYRTKRDENGTRSYQLYMDIFSGLCYSRCQKCATSFSRPAVLKMVAQTQTRTQDAVNPTRGLMQDDGWGQKNDGWADVVMWLGNR